MPGNILDRLNLLDTKLTKLLIELDRLKKENQTYREENKLFQHEITHREEEVRKARGALKEIEMYKRKLSLLADKITGLLESFNQHQI